MKSILEHCAEQPLETREAGANLIEEGAQTGCLYVLVEGKAGVLKGETCIATVTQPGSVFGEISLLLGLPHTATVQCLTACRFHVIPDGLAFLQAHPEVTLQVSRLLAQRLQSMTRYLVDLKAQYEDRSDHLGMVDEVLESLVHLQRRAR